MAIPRTPSLAADTVSIYSAGPCAPIKKDLVELLLVMGAAEPNTSPSQRNALVEILSCIKLHMLVRQSEREVQPEDNVEWVKKMFDVILSKMPQTVLAGHP